MTSGASSLDSSSGSGDAFLFSVDAVGRLRGSIVLGGTGSDGASYVVVRRGGRVLVLGSSNSPGFERVGPSGPIGQALLAWADPVRAEITYATVPVGELRFHGVTAVTSADAYLYLAGHADGLVPWSGGWTWSSGGQRLKKQRIGTATAPVAATD